MIKSIYKSSSPPQPKIYSKNLRAWPSLELTVPQIRCGEDNSLFILPETATFNVEQSKRLKCCSVCGALNGQIRCRFCVTVSKTYYDNIFN
jgi:hypothetical protein